MGGSPLTAIASKGCSRPYWVPSKTWTKSKLRIFPHLLLLRAHYSHYSVTFGLKIHSLEKTDMQSLSAPKPPVQVSVRVTMKSVSYSLYIPLTLNQGQC